MAKSERARLSRLGVLAPAALSACMDASVLAVPAAGAIVSTVLKELSRAFMLKKWYHGDLTAKEAEYLMMRCGKNGSFLVRESKGSPGDYVLSVRAHNQVSHVIIKKQNSKYNVGSGEEFDDLASLVEHFRRYPMIESSGTVLRLLQPTSDTKIRLMNNQPKIDTSPPGINGERPTRINDEFYLLQEYDYAQTSTTKEATKPRNAVKNRYKNVLPFDQTRVVLRRRQADVYSDEGDYINASYIRPRVVLEDVAASHSSTESLATVHSLDVAKREKALNQSLYKQTRLEPNRSLNVNNNYIETTTPEKLYIATQGCLKETIEDFWDMIWQEDVGLIVMITKETEKEKKKCEQYWPNKENSLSMRYLKVTTKLVTHRDDFIVREFQIEDNNKCKIVHQYQYTNWPDHSVPNNTESVLEFVDEINSVFKKDRMKTLDKRVICVHCSAGVGRTGTFIVLDMLIDKVKQNGTLDIPDIYEMVKLVRSQRAGLVQNEAQYKFLYQAIQRYTKRYHAFQR